ncbi:MAG: enoyl-CoA hydratase/isomerase family protein [Pseudonocardiaceae bacterium]|nr:enoyl-CoA hydratase/isomerase family protein [Pseudonocardiaceae bacterium]
MPERVQVDIANSVATLKLDYPPLNTFDTTMRRELSAAATELTEDARVRVVVLHSSAKVFAAGADIKQLAEHDFHSIVHWNGAMQRTLTQIATLPMPVIAAVNGLALGGGMELALAADYRIVAGSAKLGYPEVLLGIMPGSGGTQRLTRLVGPSRAKELLMTGRKITAAEALRLGMVDEVVPDGGAYEAAIEYADRLAAGPRFAIQAIKEAVDHGADAPSASGLALERSLIAGLFATEDRNTGMASFISEGPGKARFS